MAELAFDTATAACSVALRVDGVLIQPPPDPDRMFARPAHATELLPAIDALLAEAESGFDQITNVAVGVGPGAFTGLRIGVATARAICTARSIPLTPVSSLAALRAGGGSDADEVIAIVDARRKEYFFRLADGQDTLADPDQTVARAQAFVADGGSALAVGDGAVKLRDRLTEAGVEVPSQDDPRHQVDAGLLLDLAEEVRATAPHDVVPNYVRQPDAVISTRERWMVGGESA